MSRFRTSRELVDVAPEGDRILTGHETELFRQLLGAFRKTTAPRGVGVGVRATVRTAGIPESIEGGILDSQGSGTDGRGQIAGA